MLVLQHFKPLIQGKHVLVRSDNRTTVAYINRQGGVRSIALLTAAENLWLWVSQIVLSLRALHIPGRENGGADLMSRGGPLPDEWRLHPEVVKQVWTQFGRAEVDLFANRSNSHCALWFSLARWDNPPLGVDAFVHEPWPRKLLYAFPPLRLTAGTAVNHPGGPRLPPGAVVRGGNTDDGGPALGDSSGLGSAVSGSRCNRGVTHSGPTSPGLAPERDRLRQVGLSDNVIQTLQAARAESTTACYRPKWAGFRRWCEGRSLEPLSCTLGSILTYLQILVDRGLAHSTIKVYAAAISSCHEGFGGRSAFSQPLMTRFLQGVRRQRPVVHASAPQWDLPLVLEALVTEPFEPLELSSLKALSWKTALLLALTSAKRVSELTALSVHPSCLLIRGDRSGATLRPNPSFTPKSMGSSFRSRAIQLGGLILHPMLGPGRLSCTSSAQYGR
ncbi:hypothetical protein CgunFtcFv8_015639 [Champsocephalus gunnari]|uniref:Core-binding (CB) domain-containing protein n=1 Tax=Champsocephalus gunnari TaxID=52237 RepID=A0AAN8C643_CHAGU|nr:hypothetical protein CgunFtcFv8_015639 [Champsocephalus gunnari]